MSMPTAANSLRSGGSCSSLCTYSSHHGRFWLWKNQKKNDAVSRKFVAFLFRAGRLRIRSQVPTISWCWTLLNSMENLHSATVHNIMALIWLVIFDVFCNHVSQYMCNIHKHLLPVWVSSIGLWARLATESIQGWWVAFTIYNLLWMVELALMLWNHYNLKNQPIKARMVLVDSGQKSFKKGLSHQEIMETLGFLNCVADP